MPDKHEVGGSSPLGPTSRTKQRYEHFKKRKRLFSNEVRDKFLKVVRVHLGLPEKIKIAQEQSLVQGDLVLSSSEQSTSIVTLKQSERDLESLRELKLPRDISTGTKFSCLT